MKNLNQNFNIFLFLIFLAMPMLSTAQAWTKSKKSGFYKLDYSNNPAEQVFDNKGKLVPIRTLGNNVTSFYGEYGVSDKLTLVAYMPFLVRNSLAATITQPAISVNGFGDTDLGVRYQLYNKNGISASGNLLLGLPTGKGTQADGLIMGDGEFNQLVKIAIGTGKKRWWTQGAVGFNNRTNAFSDEFRYDLEFGYKFFNDRLLTILKINGVESLNNGTVKETTTGLFSNNVEYIGVGPEFLYYANKKKNIGVSLRLANGFKARNVQAALTTQLGIIAAF